VFLCVSFKALQWLSISYVSKTSIYRTPIYLSHIYIYYTHKTPDLLNAEGLNPDYIALAAWSLSRAFVKPNKLSMHTKEGYPKAVPKVSTVIETTGSKKKGGIERSVELRMYGGGGLSGLEDDMVGNDNMYRQLDDDDDDDLFEDGGGDDSKNIFALSEHISLPTMEDITDEVLLRHPNESPLGMGSGGSKDSDEDEEDDDEPYYEHNDTHASNGHRFYLLNGLASDATSSTTAAMPNPRGFTPTGGAGANNSSQVVNIHGSPLTIAEIASAGLTSLRAKSRIQAEKDMVSSSLFQQFVQAASAGGFFSEKRGDEKRFNDSSDDNELSIEEKERRSQLLYQDKYRKVVNKFRSKLANKEAQILNPPTTPSHPYHSASPRMNSAYKIMSGGASVSSAGGNTIDSIRNVNGVNDRLLERRERRMEKVKSQRSKTKAVMPSSTSPSTPSKLKEDDYQEAERFNTTGNTLMQDKQFQQALDAYTSALARPVGPNSHVYYSNRSAAYLSLNQYDESIRDSEKSLALQPNYAKAYSRLGLTYFACGRYSDAVTAYESALRIDPDNEWTRDHLAKAKEMIDDGGEGEKGIDPPSDDEENWPTPFDKNNGKEEIETGGKGGMTQQEQEDLTRQADNYKDKGNEYMSNKDYDQALQQYNLAIELSPSGPHSHVYYSNRAAAYCYLANYLEATADCETSIKLMPTYEKAHARLGLSFFFRGQYDDAIAAYNRSLELDPNNKASMSYLKKAKARLAEQKKKEEEEHLRAEEERERNRTRMQWLAQQRQYQQNNNQQQQQQGGDDDEGSLGDNTGITSTGLTSIVTNNDDEVEVSMSYGQEEAFDPFSTKDDE